MEAEAQLHFTLFGALALSKGSQPSALPYTEAARSLLAFLLLNYPKPQQRAVLAGLFGPEKPEIWTRQRLSQALYQLRRWLPGFVISDTHTLALNSDFSPWVDALAFIQLLAFEPDSHRRAAAVQTTRQQRIQTLQQAILLYQGDLLEGFYEDWVLVEREVLREKYLRALSELIELEKSSGKYSEALEHALRRAQAEPLQEAYHREVMRLQFALQKPEAALQQYALCCQILKDEFSLQPDAETSALAQEIISRSNLQPEVAPFLPATIPTLRQADNPLTGQMPLIGRETERRQLTDILDETLRGFGSIALIDGEAGVGKSRLVQELARAAEWHSAQVLWGFGRESEGSQPYGPLVEALNSGLTPLRVEELIQLLQPIWLSVLAPLLPGLASNQITPERPAALPPAQERERLFFALHQLLTAWAEIRPMVLILEDMQWFDEDTLDLLSHLGETASQESILIICTYRSEEARIRPGVWDKLQAIHHQSASQYICLERLSASASSEIIQRALRLNTPVQIFETRLFQETAGNPLFILETLRLLQDEGLLYQGTDGNWNTVWDAATQDYHELPLSPVIEQSISRRLKQLPTNARRLLELAAVAGSQCEVGLLRSASETDPRVLITLLQTLVQRNILKESQSYYIFGHDKLRQVVYTEIQTNERARLHRKYAQALKTMYPERVTALAYHCTHGEMWSEAVKYHRLASKRAEAVFANQLAWEHCTKALEILDQQEPFSVQEGAELAYDLLFARSNLAWMKGDVAQQKTDILALVKQAELLPNPRRKIEALIQQAIYLCNTRDEYEKAEQAAADALELAEKYALLRLAASAWQQIGVARQRSDHYSPAEQALQKSVALWQSMPTETVALAEANIYLAQVYERTGDIRRAMEQAQKVVNLAQQNDAPLTLARAYALLATLAYRENDFNAAVEYNQHGLEQARKIGHKHNEAVMLCNLGFDYWALGDYAKTIGFTRQGFEIYRQLGNRRGMVLCCDNLSALYNEIGQYSQAQMFITDGLESARQIGFPYEEGLLLSNLGRFYLEQNDLQSATQAYQQALAVAQSIDSPYVSAGACLGLGIVLHAQKAYDQAGEQFALALENYNKAGESAFATGARSFLALNTLSAGNLQDALDLSTQATVDLETAGGGEYVQDTYWHHFLILTAAGQTEQAYQTLQKAAQTIQDRAATLPPDWRDSFLKKVSINQRILQAWANFRPTILPTRLPCAEAPTGRPLQENEWVEVNWTVSTTADLEIADKQERRRARIMRLLGEARSQGAAPTIDDLARALKASPATIKRDLAILRQAGHKIATRGERTF
jgi:predicted ATPase/DNA-binding SARP family transcriptional activator